ncbi:uncharacterized protein LOC122503758 [Leptopilina heterotoma]|uniref:uncharacterized protein LOC122503758 n=1 Tax=Leptopilina heterotoma TaxID=63436 RepID=UPI001CA84531|nr:uncharacterized protein LOC122503758 [Leptopilina heterotoma]
MELKISSLFTIPFVCAIFTYFLFRKVKKNGVSRKSVFDTCYSSFKSFFFNDKKKSVYTYLGEEKFEKLKIIENMEIEELQKKFQEDISVCSLFYGTDQKGNSLFLKLNHKGNDKELILFLYLSDGRVYELPDHPSTIAFNSTNQSWSIGGVKISVCEPLVRWRITFNGLLRNGTRKYIADDMGKIEHVRFNFIFIANSVPLRKSDFSNNDVEKYSEELEKFDQWGSLVGQILFEDSSTKECFLRGFRQRKCERLIISKFDKILSYFGSIDGLTFYLNIGKLKDSSEIVKFGHLKTINNTILEIDWMDLNIDCDVNLEKNGFENIHFNAGNDYEFSVKLQKNSKRSLHHGHNVDEKYVTYKIKLERNNKEGSGLVFLCYPEKAFASSTANILETSFPLHSPQVLDVETFTVSFRDEICQNEELVGGKAKSLALLSSIETYDFYVPQGFCILASALQYQLDSCKNLSLAINDIERININEIEDLKNSCEKVVLLLKTSAIVEPVRKAILKALSDLENAEKNNQMNLRYAVRSSAIGEDSEDTSAAGQNSTFLGIQDSDNVLKYVSQCWASLYSHQSVEYRRRSGLPVKASMGVCIQIMVDAEIAGVMFTRHPTTGDPRNIVITSNYGLGETVVSAMVEPDTVIIERNWNDALTIESIEIGKKYQKITMTNDSGTILKELSDEETRKNSISNRIALNLAKVGVNLENLFQNARDIEWAIIGDNIFLLQSRPITSLDNWTDFELTYELDSIVPVENDILTFANVGEVFPGVTSPLTISTFIYLLNCSLNNNFKMPSIVPYCDIHIHASSMRITINYLNTMLACVTKELRPSVKVSDVAVCGHVITTPEIYNQAKERNGVSLWGTTIQTIFMITDAWKAEATLKEMENIFTSMTLDANRFDKIEDLYRAIDESLIYLQLIGGCHNLTSRVSVFYEILLMSILMENSDDLTVDHFSDIAVLLSSCNNVISAQVPIALRRIANLIRDTGKWEEFAQINTKDVINWLEMNSPHSLELLQEFLKTYGHRNIKEMDFITETWDMKPEKLFNALQAMVKVTLENTEIVDLTPEETILKLKTPKKNATRWILGKIVPFGRKAVARREMTKSIMTNALHKFRLSYRKLAKLLIEKNRLPDENLIFFLTHYEIGLLVKRADHFLVRKAFRRQRLYSKLEKDQFAELNVGVPNPLELANINFKHRNVKKVMGSSVYNGTVYARACVITNVSQADEIKSGDILITRATDIGWSPYFPLLGGIVTELGGLISHGAVVAREYGIPCIVGAEGATLIFKTGQMVLLNATIGTVEIAEDNS